MVYDLMVRLRPVVDRLVVDSLRSHTFAPSDVVLTERRVCQLLPQVARVMAYQAIREAAVEEVGTARARNLALEPVVDSGVR